MMGQKRSQADQMTSYMNRLTLGVILTVSIWGIGTKASDLDFAVTSSSSDLVLSDLEDGAVLVQVDQGQDLNITFRTGLEGFTASWYLPNPEINHRVEAREDKERGVFSILINGVRQEDQGGVNFTASKEGKVLFKRIVIKVKTDPAGPCSSDSSFFFKCPTSSHCIGRRYVCDGIVDCPEDGADESVEQCGPLDPCASKLRCKDHRCMDPSLCCDPHIDPNCTVVPSCCLALIESNRHFYMLGMEKRNELDGRSSRDSVTAYIIIGCFMAIVGLLLIVTAFFCRIQLGGGRTSSVSLSFHPRAPLTLHDLDLYFGGNSQHRRNNGNSNNPIGITYNINNGVQFVGPPPPPYQARQQDPPPPYEGAAAAANNGDSSNNADEDETGGLLNNNNEDNNNGDINGNSEMVNQNMVMQEAAAARLLEAAAAANEGGQ